MAYPTAAMGAPQSDPAENDPADGPEDDMSSGYVVCLTVKPDGTMSIDVESLQEEMQEEDPEGTEPDESKPVDSLPAAFKMIQTIVGNNGQMDSGDPFKDAHADAIKSRTPPSMGNNSGKGMM